MSDKEIKPKPYEAFEVKPKLINGLLFCVETCPAWEVCDEKESIRFCIPLTRRMHIDLEAARTANTTLKQVMDDNHALRAKLARVVEAAKELQEYTRSCAVTWSIPKRSSTIVNFDFDAVKDAAIKDAEIKP